MCFRLPAGLEDLAGKQSSLDSAAWLSQSSQLDASSEDLLLPAFSRWLRGWTLRLRCGQDELALGLCADFGLGREETGGKFEDIIVARREAPLVLQEPELHGLHVLLISVI